MDSAPSTTGHEAAQQHGGNQRNGIGLKQVGRHTGTIANVVTDVICNNGRIARIILGNSRFHLTHEICAHICALGKDATTQPRKYGDERAAEGQAYQRMQGIRLRATHFLQESIVSRHSQQTQANHQQTGNGTAPEREV